MVQDEQDEQGFLKLSHKTKSMMEVNAYDR